MLSSAGGWLHWGFVVITIPPGLSMLKIPKKDIRKRGTKTKPHSYPLILIGGMLIGSVTGLVGAGGGFLIIPALIFFTNIYVK